MTSLADFADAIKRGDSSRVQALLDSGSIDINAALPVVNAPPALVFAARLGQVAIVELLLKAGALIGGTDAVGWTACHAAVAYTRAVLPVLLKHGPDLRARDANDQSVLDVAITARREPNIILLLGAGATHASAARLCEAATISAAVVRALRDSGLVVSELRTSERQTPLQLVAARRHDPALMQALVDCGVDIDARNYQGYTAVHYAAWHGHALQLSWLIDAGADVDVPNNGEWSPLHSAGWYDRADSVVALVVAGADVRSRSSNGSTACHFAAESFLGKIDTVLSIVHVLAAAGADLDARDSDGTTPRETLEGRFLSVDLNEVESARRRIAKLRLDSVRHRALQVCIGLQSRGLDALQTCEILLHACGRCAPLIPFHQWWKIATTVKHFR